MCKQKTHDIIFQGKEKALWDLLGGTSTVCQATGGQKACGVCSSASEETLTRRAKSVCRGLGPRSSSTGACEDPSVPGLSLCVGGRGQVTGNDRKQTPQGLTWKLRLR